MSTPAAAARSPRRKRPALLPRGVGRCRRGRGCGIPSQRTLCRRLRSTCPPAFRRLRAVRRRGARAVSGALALGAADAERGAGAPRRTRSGAAPRTLRLDCQLCGAKFAAADSRSEAADSGGSALRSRPLSGAQRAVRRRGGRAPELERRGGSFRLPFLGPREAGSAQPHQPRSYVTTATTEHPSTKTIHTRAGPFSRPFLYCRNITRA